MIQELEGFEDEQPARTVSLSHTNCTPPSKSNNTANGLLVFHKREHDEHHIVLLYCLILSNHSDSLLSTRFIDLHSNIYCSVSSILAVPYDFLYFTNLGISCIYLKHFCNVLFISFTKKIFNTPFLARTVGKRTWRISNCKENDHFLSREKVSLRISSTRRDNRNLKEECVKKLRFKRLTNGIVNGDWNCVQTFYISASNYQKNPD